MADWNALAVFWRHFLVSLFLPQLRRIGLLTARVQVRCDAHNARKWAWLDARIACQWIRRPSRFSERIAQVDERLDRIRGRHGFAAVLADRTCPLKINSLFASSHFQHYLRPQRMIRGCLLVHAVFVLLCILSLHAVVVFLCSLCNEMDIGRHIPFVWHLMQDTSWKQPLALLGLEVKELAGGVKHLCY